MASTNMGAAAPYGHERRPGGHFVSIKARPMQSRRRPWQRSSNSVLAALSSASGGSRIAHHSPRSIATQSSWSSFRHCKPGRTVTQASISGRRSLRLKGGAIGLRSLWSRAISSVSSVCRYHAACCHVPPVWKWVGALRALSGAAASPVRPRTRCSVRDSSASGWQKLFPSRQLATSDPALSWSASACATLTVTSNIPVCPRGIRFAYTVFTELTERTGAYMSRNPEASVCGIHGKMPRSSQ